MKPIFMSMCKKTIKIQMKLFISLGLPPDLDLTVCEAVRSAGSMEALGSAAEASRRIASPPDTCGEPQATSRSMGEQHGR